MQTNFENILCMAPYFEGEVHNQSLCQKSGHLAGEVIPFGAPLYYDTATSTVKKMVAHGTSPFFGIAARVLHESVGGTVSTSANTGTTMTITTNSKGYAINDVVSVLKMGTIVVKVTTVTDSVIGANVFWKKADATLYVQSSGTPVTAGDILIGYAKIKPVADLMPITLIQIPQV